jgi:hypothetical protein
MSIIRPPVSGDSPQDSWANQVTEAINKGLLAPSVNPSAGSNVISSGGLNAATIYLYTRTTVPTAPATLTTDVTYDYRTTTFTPSAPLGSANWQQSPPGTSSGDYLWVINVNISAATDKEVIAASSWSSPAIFSINGTSSLAIEVFLRAASAPSTPTGGSYNFGTKSVTPPTGWSATFPAGSNPVYISSTIASISGTTGTDSSLTWSSPVKMVEDGTPATEIESGRVYYNQPSTNSPGTPSASGYNFVTGAFTGLTANWQTQPVTVNITTTTALFWSTRYRITQASGASPTVTFDTPIASINFGNNIQSDNYVSGSAGWQIQRATGNAEFGNITARGTLKSSNFDGTFNSLSQTISTYSSATGVFAANTWGLRDGFGNNASNISASSWNNYLDPVSNTVHVVLKIRASTAAQTEIISQLGRGQQLTITRNATNNATFEVWTAGYLPEDGNTAYVQLRSLVGTAAGVPASAAITLAASNVVDPGTKGYFFNNDKSVINSGTLDVANIRINGSIQAKNLDIGITLQSKSGNRSGVITNWAEFLRIETTDNPDFDTDVTYSSQVTVVSEAGVGDIVFIKVLDTSQLGTEGSATYSSSQIGLSVGSVTSFANTIDSASIQANSPSASSSFTTSMSDSNVNVTRGTTFLFCYRERPGGDTAIGCSASASITEVRRAA